MNNLLSICIPTYNRSSFLREAVTSVLSQTYKNFELIIVDNASVDDTKEVADSFRDNRIRYFKNDKFLELGANWNRCLDLAEGKYICIFHDDDLMLPDNLQKKIDVLLNHSAVALIHSNINRINEKGEIIGKHWAKRHKKDYYSNAGTELFLQLLLEDSPICSPTVIVKKEVFSKVGVFNSKLSYACDWEMWMRISLFYDSAYICEPLVNYRCHKGMLTQKFLRTNGLDQIYQAKINVLNACSKDIKNIEVITRSVKSFYKKRGFDLFVRYFFRGWIKEALESLLFVLKIS